MSYAKAIPIWTYSRTWRVSQKLKGILPKKQNLLGWTTNQVMANILSAKMIKLKKGSITLMITKLNLRYKPKKLNRQLIQTIVMEYRLPSRKIPQTSICHQVKSKEKNVSSTNSLSKLSTIETWYGKWTIRTTCTFRLQSNTNIDWKPTSDMATTHLWYWAWSSVEYGSRSLTNCSKRISCGRN